MKFCLSMILETWPIWLISMVCRVLISSSSLNWRCYRSLRCWASLNTNAIARSSGLSEFSGFKATVFLVEAGLITLTTNEALISPSSFFFISLLASVCTCGLSYDCMAIKQYRPLHTGMEAILTLIVQLSIQIDMLTPNRRYKMPPSSTRHSSSESLPHREAYLGFKEKLLRAMAEMDPLDLLQSGIFEQYETYLGITPSDLQHKLHIFSENVSDFQTVLRSYDLSDEVAITQLERRSLSCEKMTAEDRAVRRMQEQRNIQFVVFANSCGFLNNKKPQDKSIQQLDERLSELRKELAEKDAQNSRLSERLRETESRLQQLRHAQPIQNDKTDKELQYLLKEKQLMKKLHDARVEAEQLRLALEVAEDQLQKNAPKAQPILQQVQQDTGNLQNLREKVINQGRRRSLLAQISGMQLNMRCGLESQAQEKQ